MKLNHVQITQEQRENQGNHFDYFASLENKLLEESDKLTNIMGKSLINQKSLKQLRQNLSTGTFSFNQGKLVTQTCKTTPRFSHRKQTHKSDNYIDKAKQLVRIMKQAHNHKDNHVKPSQQSTKDKYQHLRKVVYSVCKHNKHEIQEKPLTLEGGKQQKIKIKKGSRGHHEVPSTISLKQTISTSSQKSLQFLSQQIGQLMINQKIKLDDFVPVKMLGQGKMGQVCLVSHKKTGLLYALKQIPQNQISKDSKIIMQIIRQIKVQSFLDHPNIVQLYSVFVQESNLYLLMQFCAEGDLYQHLKDEGSFSEQKIRMVIKQICHAVQYMHDNDILHRDLKPQNILFHEICDFGWAVHSPLLRDTLCGTPLYSSPQLVQKQQYDNKIDIWNIGILTYELAYGRVPFQIRNEDDVIKVVEQEIYFPRSKPASPQIKDFILRCLSKNPKDRFSITKLIDHQFLNPMVRTN